MRIINELNKIGKQLQLLTDPRDPAPYPPHGYPVPSHSYPPPVYQGYAPASAVPMAGAVSPPAPVAGPAPPPAHQNTWPPPQAYPQSPPQAQFQAPQGQAQPSYTTGYSSPPASYAPFQASPPVVGHSSPPFSPPGAYAPGPSSPPSSAAAAHSPLSFSTHTHSPSHAHSLPAPQYPSPAPPPPAPVLAHTPAPAPDPADWPAALQALLPPCVAAARAHVACAHTQPDTIWLYFVDLGAVYFADAVYGIDGNAFGRDELAWAGVPPHAGHAELYRVLAGEWVTKICLRSRVEEVHPSRVVVRVDVATGAFGSTMCYEVASVRHPTLAPAQVLALWVARLKATGNDSAEFMPA
ncbi:unnamed protein product [Cutaneotrichosporon oleaginosum]